MIKVKASQVYSQAEQPMTKQEYYKLLIEHKDDILYDVEMYNQGVIAKKLNLTPTAMSIVVHMLKAL